MTVWIIPGGGGGGGYGQSVSSGSKVANHNETPTEKTSSGVSPLGISGPPPLLGRKEGTLSSQKNSLKKNINKENLIWVGGRDHNDIPRHHKWPHPA